MNPTLRRLPLVICALPVLMAVNGADLKSATGEPPRFVIAAPGIAYSTFEIHADDAEAFSGYAFKIDLDVAELRLIPAGDPPSRRKVEQIIGPFPPEPPINAIS